MEASTMTAEEDILTYRERLRARSQHLLGPRADRPDVWLKRIASWCSDHDVSFERYGSGKLVEDFEAKVAARLGYPAARFMPSGTMAQSIAMRLWCDRVKVNHFAMHPTPHVELHEERGYAHLHGLNATLLGVAQRPTTAADLQALREPIAALLVELPIREAGGATPELDGAGRPCCERDFSRCATASGRCPPVGDGKLLRKTV